MKFIVTPMAGQVMQGAGLTHQEQLGVPAQGISEMWTWDKMGVEWLTH